MIFWVIRMVCIKHGMVVNIVRAYLSRHKIVHILGSFVDPISIDVTDNFEYQAIDAAYMNVDCDATMFTTDVDCSKFDCNTFWFKEFKYSIC